MRLVCRVGVEVERLQGPLAQEDVAVVERLVEENPRELLRCDHALLGQVGVHGLFVLEENFLRVELDSHERKVLVLDRRDHLFAPEQECGQNVEILGQVFRSLEVLQLETERVGKVEQWLFGKGFFNVRSQHLPEKRALVGLWVSINAFIKVLVPEQSFSHLVAAEAVQECFEAEADAENREPVPIYVLLQSKAENPTHLFHVRARLVSISSAV